MLLQHDVAKANQIGIHHDTLIPTQEGWIDSYFLDDFVDAAQLHQNIDIIVAHRRKQIQSR